MPDMGAVSLQPLRASHEFDDVEAQLKAMTLDLFRDHLSEQVADINVYGAPHLGSSTQIEQWIKADGLAVMRGDIQNSMRYLFKAWRGQKARRGLHFLRTYLQLLWPNAWVVNQLWQRKSATYPQALFTRDELTLLGVQDPSDGYFLTSRINVDVYTSDATAAGITQVTQALQSVCGARYIVNIRVSPLKKVQTSLLAANIFSGTQLLVTEGTTQ